MVKKQSKRRDLATGRDASTRAEFTTVYTARAVLGHGVCSTTNQHVAVAAHLEDDVVFPQRLSGAYTA